MERILLLAAITLIVCAIPARAHDEAMVTAQSPYPVNETMDRLERTAKAAGLKVFARIDHAEGAASVDMTLRPTQLLVFGNPKGGTPLMRCAQTIGMDLPLKALVWQDSSGQAWLAYNDPQVIARRHGAENCDAASKVGQSLRKLVADALASTDALQDGDSPPST